eukprot:369190-Hanusia_phi.AAC.1
MIATFLSTAIYFIFFWPSKFAETLDGLRRKQEQQEQNKKVCHKTSNPTSPYNMSCRRHHYKCWRSPHQLSFP